MPGSGAGHLIQVSVGRTLLASALTVRSTSKGRTNPVCTWGGRGGMDMHVWPGEGGLRELIISRRRSGYLARYELDDARDLVLVARIRHQWESGYAEGEV